MLTKMKILRPKIKLNIPFVKISFDIEKDEIIMCIEFGLTG